MDKKNQQNTDISLCNNISYYNYAKDRQKNRKWLKYSGKVALRILAAMEDIPAMNQKVLAGLVGVSPQQVSKIVKGQENLTLETIAKFSEVLKCELISFPNFKYNRPEAFEVRINSNFTMLFNITMVFRNEYIYYDADNENAFIDLKTPFTLTTENSFLQI